MRTEGADSDLLAPDEARARVLGLVRRLPAERVSLSEAGGRVLDESIVADVDLPRFDNSAMDGFAVRSTDTASPVSLRMVGHAYAGRPAGVAVGPGDAVSIATGAQVPHGADAVIRLEDAGISEGRVEIRAPVPVGTNIRRRGEDVPRGRTVIEAGAILGPGQMAALAALGRVRVAVVGRARVAIVPTGDEVRPPGARVGPGQVHDAVSAPLSLLLREMGAVPCERPPAPDDAEGLFEALREASVGADMVLTVGGASMGERDAVHSLARAGEVEAVRVALRPAKPFVLGRIFGVPLFGLPGNPAAALAAFEELVRPAVLALMGRNPAPRAAATATLTEPLRQQPGRLHLMRVEVWREEGRLWARSSGSQGAGMIHSLARANAWAVIPAAVAELPAGSEVEVRMLTDLR